MSGYGHILMNLFDVNDEFIFHNYCIFHIMTCENPFGICFRRKKQPKTPKGLVFVIKNKRSRANTKT